MFIGVRCRGALGLVYFRSFASILYKLHFPTSSPAGIRTVFTRSLLLWFLIACAFLAGGCRENTRSADSLQSSKPPTNTESEQPSGPFIRELPDEGKLVKELLDVDAHVFEFSGTLLAVTVQAETKIEGEESIVHQLGPVVVTQESIENDPPQSIRGKFLVSGKVMENPRLRIFFKSESKGGGQSMQVSSLAPPWPKIVMSSGTGYKFECPAKLPDEGEEFLIASIHKTALVPQPKNEKPYATKVVRETTIRIKGKRLPGAREPAPHERVAVEALRNARASVYLEGGNAQASAIKVSFPYLHESLEKDTLIHLKQLAKLEILDLTYTPIADDELVHLKDLSTLQELRLGRNVTAAGLEHLRGLSKLKVLRVGSGISRASSDEDLASFTVADDGLTQLTGLTNLEVLSLQLKTGKFTDEATAHLAALTKLRELHFGANELTESGLERLGSLGELEKLDLHDCKVNDAGLKHLEKLSQLKLLSFQFGDASEEALRQFKKALPDCTIRNSRPAKLSVD